VSLLHELTALQLVDARQSGELSATELVAHFLQRIQSLNPSVNAVVTSTPEHALERARAMDEGILEPGMLWGLPTAEKDLSNREGVKTGFGSKTQSDAPVASASDPLVVALDHAGAISLGKTAVCEFGLSSYTESEVFAPTANPHAPHLGSGGSSGGAAAAVAAGMLPVAPGNDGGGSVRIPAWTCGVVGHKPSRGLIPTGTGFDSLGGLVVPGPLARTVADAALLLDALVGDGITHRASGQAARAESFVEQTKRPPRPLRIGLTTASPWDEWTQITLDPQATSAVERVAGIAQSHGHEVEVWDWKPPAGYAEAFIALWSSFAVLLEVPQNRRDQLEPLTRHLVETGARLPARTLAGALVALARYETQVIEQFSRFDLVLTPGLATLPPPIGFYDRVDPERNFRQQVEVTPFSSFVNVSGLPALALPVMATPEGIPIGVQLIGAPGGDATVLALGAQLEAELGWVGHRPILW